MARGLPNFLACCLIVLVAVAPARAADPGATEREIARLEQACNDAYGRNDLDRYFGYYADGAVLIFYDGRTTLAEYRKSWTESGRAGNTVASWTLSDLVIRVSPAGDAEVASYHVDARNRHADGRTSAEQGFETDVWVRRGGAWRLEHAQYALAVAAPN